MSKSTSAAGRILDDDDPAISPFRAPDRSRSHDPQVEPPRLIAPAPEVVPTPVTFRRAQHACYEALGLALKEGQVFAAVTGPQDSGKTRVLDAVLADWRDRSLRCIRITEPDKVPAQLAAQIEQVAYDEAAKPENLERHIVLAIDDAHTATDELLQCLTRLAMMREPGRRVPQVLLVGRPELWTRLTAEAYAPLARRLAIRAVLPALEEEATDPWATVEQEVSQLRSEGGVVPLRSTEPMVEPTYEPIYDQTYGRQYGHAHPSAIDPATLALDEASVLPPSMFALFPDPPPRAEPVHERTARRFPWLPLGCLAVTVVAVLSFYDWPDLFDDVPWAQTKPATPFVISPALQAQSHGLPQPPSWAQSAAKPLNSPAPAAPPLVAAEIAPPPVSPPVSPPVPPPVPPRGNTLPTRMPLAETLARPPAPLTNLRVADLPPARAAIPDPAPRPAPEPPKPQIVASLPPALAEQGAPAAASSAPPPQAANPAPQPRAPTVAEPSKPLAPSSAAAQQATAPILSTPPIPAPPLPNPPPSGYMANTAAASTGPSVPASRLSAETPAVVTVAPLSPAIVALLLRRGDEQAAIGDLSAARLLFERAAESGSGKAAFHLARTYDTAFLPSADSQNLGDRAQARTWYARAASLGNRDAAERLKTIGQGR